MPACAPLGLGLVRYCDTALLCQFGILPPLFMPSNPATVPLCHAVLHQGETVPSKKPRIAITVDHEVHAKLMQFAKDSGIPAATLIGQLIPQLLPLIESMGRAIKQAKESPVQALELLNHELAKVNAQSSALQLDLVGEIAKVRGAPPDADD